MADLIYMAKTKWTALLDSIRAKGGTSALMTADQAKAAVEAIPTGGGGIEKAEGDFTIVSESGDNAPTLTHNLGTQKIAVLIYPKSKITANNGYHNFFAEVINVNALCDGQTWAFDWTSYNTHFSADETAVIPNVNLKIGTVHVSPWTTQSNWYSGGNPPTIANGVQNNEYRVVYTDNTVRVRGAGGGIIWASGTYHWIVWKLG